MKELLELLAKNNLTLGSVESMTGGLFASEFTSVGGASKVFKGSLVTYQVSEKVHLLGIDENIIKEHGVVSSEVAMLMAEKGRKILDVDVCVSVTGNAGPTCEPGCKPVGAVYIGLSSSKGTIFKELSLSGDRNEIRQETVEIMQKFIKSEIF